MSSRSIALAILCAWSLPAAGSEPACPTLRLPASVRPLRARLELTIDPAQESYSGRVSYDVRLTKATDVLWVNATGLRIEDAVVRAGATSLRGVAVKGNEDFAGFRFPSLLQPGVAKLTLRWRGTLDGTRSQGLYRVKEGDDWYAYTFFEPIDARRAFPCFDEPGAKIPWTLVLHVPASQTGAANARALAEAAEPGGMKRIEFAETRPLPSYLVALVVGPFDVVSAGTAGHHDTPLRFIVPRGRGGETRLAAEATPRLVGLLEDFFGIPYPYGKLDVAVVPRFWGTMEHPGLLAMGQPLTLVKPGEETPERRKSYANIAVHELGHYWFGDVVTMAWWDDTWLNEGTTTWLDAKMTDAYEPAWRTSAERLQSISQAMTDDALPSAKRVREPVTSKDAIQNSFDSSLTYYKGNAILSMVEHWIGEDRLQRIVRAYLQQHLWGSASSEDWLRAVAEGAGPQAREVFRTFIEQPGVPVVSGRLRRTAQGWMLELTQRRFLASGDEKESPQLWTIPVGVRLGSKGANSATSYMVLDGRTGAFPIPGDARPDWVCLNAGASGYYRVSYDADQLKAFTGPSAAPLTAPERIQLLEDAKSLGQKGVLDLGSTMDLASTFANDPDRLIVAESVALAGRIPTGLLSVADKDRWHSYVQGTWGGRAESLGWSPAADESVETRRLRNLVVPFVVSSGDSERLCSAARPLVDTWLRNRTGLDPDLVRPALTAAARCGDRALFDQLRGEAGRAQDHSDREKILFTLGAFRDPALLQEALGLVVDGPFDIRDSLRILYVALYGAETRPVAWAWLKANFAKVAEMSRSDETCGLIESLGNTLWDTVDREDLRTFLEPRVKPIDGAPIALARALETFDVKLGRGRRDLEPSVQFLRAR
jgi:aminopeptidase N